MPVSILLSSMRIQGMCPQGSVGNLKLLLMLDRISGVNKFISRKMQQTCPSVSNKLDIIQLLSLYCCVST